MVDALKVKHQPTVNNACSELYRDICVSNKVKQHFEQGRLSTSEGVEVCYLLFYVPNRNHSLALHRQLTTGVQSPFEHKHIYKFKRSVFRYSNYVQYETEMTQIDV